MKKEPRYSDVKFNVSDLELRKHRIINKAPCKNCGCSPCNCDKADTPQPKPESAWEKRCSYLEKILNKHGIGFDKDNE